MIAKTDSDNEVTGRPRVSHASGASSWQRRGSGPRLGPYGSRGNGTLRRRHWSVSGSLVFRSRAHRQNRARLRASTLDRLDDAHAPISVLIAPRENEAARKRRGGEDKTRARRVHGPRDYARCVVSRLIKIPRRSVHSRSHVRRAWTPRWARESLWRLYGKTKCCRVARIISSQSS